MCDVSRINITIEVIFFLFFSIVQCSGFAHVNVLTMNFKLMALWKIMVEEDLHSKNASGTMKQTSHRG